MLDSHGSVGRVELAAGGPVGRLRRRGSPAQEELRPALHIASIQTDDDVRAALRLNLVEQAIGACQQFAVDLATDGQFRNQQGGQDQRLAGVVGDVLALEHLTAAVGGHLPAIGRLGASGHGDFRGELQHFAGPHRAAADDLIDGEGVSQHIDKLDAVMPGAGDGGRAQVAHLPGDEHRLPGGHLAGSAHRDDDQVQIRVGRLHELESAQVRGEVAVEHAGVRRARIVVARGAPVIRGGSRQRVRRVDHGGGVAEPVVILVGIHVLWVDGDVAVGAGLVGQAAVVDRAGAGRRPDVGVADLSDGSEVKLNARGKAVADDGVVDVERAAVDEQADTVVIDRAVGDLHGRAGVGADGPIDAGEHGVADVDLTTPGKHAVVEGVGDDAVGNVEPGAAGGAQDAGLVPVSAGAAAVADVSMVEGGVTGDVHPAPVARLRGCLVAVVVGVAADRIVVHRREDDGLGGGALRDERSARLYENPAQIRDLHDRPGHDRQAGAGRDGQVGGDVVQLLGQPHFIRGDGAGVGHRHVAVLDVLVGVERAAREDTDAVPVAGLGQRGVLIVVRVPARRVVVDRGEDDGVVRGTVGGDRRPFGRSQTGAANELDCRARLDRQHHAGSNRHRRLHDVDRVGAPGGILKDGAAVPDCGVIDQDLPHRLGEHGAVGVAQHCPQIIDSIVKLSRVDRRGVDGGEALANHHRLSHAGECQIDRRRQGVGARHEPFGGDLPVQQVTRRTEEAEGDRVLSEDECALLPGTGSAGAAVDRQVRLLHAERVRGGQVDGDASAAARAARAVAVAAVGGDEAGATQTGGADEDAASGAGGVAPGEAVAAVGTDRSRDLDSVGGEVQQAPAAAA